MPLEVSVWHNAGYQIDSTDPDRAMPDGLAAAYQFMPAAGPGQWVWCFLDETVGLWVMLQPFEDIIRVQLAEDWYACDSAAANILIALGDADEWLGFATGYAVTVYDPLGAIANDLLAVSDSSGNWYMPAGTCAIVKRFADDNAWEPLRFMPGQCPTSSSSSSSSGSSGSSSGSSGSSSGIESSGSGSGGGGACACQMLCPVCVDNEGRVVGGYVASLVNTGGGSGCSSGTSSFDLVVSGTWWSPIGCPEPGSSSGSSGSGSSGSGSSGSSGSGGSGWQLVAQGLTDPTNEPGPLQSTSVPMDCIGANLIVVSIAYQGSAYLSQRQRGQQLDADYPNQRRRCDPECPVLLPTPPYRPRKLSTSTAIQVTR